MCCHQFLVDVPVYDKGAARWVMSQGAAVLAKAQDISSTQELDHA